MSHAPALRSTATFLTMAASLLTAQTAPRPPVVNPDRTITFSLSAPNAKQVYLGCEFDERYNAPPGAPMTKGENGVWTFTSSPVEPGLYYYGYVVDGLFTLDPGNQRYRPEINVAPLNNIVEVPGDTPRVYEPLAGAAHGTVHSETLESAVLKRTINFHVYTPPSYGKGNDEYPALYLMHGSPGTGRQWVLHGLADTIMDRLIAEGKAKEMVLVMFDAQISLPATTVEQNLANLDQFEQYLVSEIVPGAEARYRIRKSQDSRWIAGLSRGGAQAFHAGAHRPDLFSAIGMFSVPLPSTYPAAYAELADGAKFAARVPLLYYTCGRDDIRYASFQTGRASLGDRGLPVESASHPGGHIWEVWRNSLAEFVTRLK